MHVCVLSGMSDRNQQKEDGGTEKNSWKRREGYCCTQYSTPVRAEEQLLQRRLRHAGVDEHDREQRLRARVGGRARAERERALHERGGQHLDEQAHLAHAQQAPAFARGARGRALVLGVARGALALLLLARGDLGLHARLFFLADARALLVERGRLAPQRHLGLAVVVVLALLHLAVVLLPNGFLGVLGGLRGLARLDRGGLLPHGHTGQRVVVVVAVLRVAPVALPVVVLVRELAAVGLGAEVFQRVAAFVCVAVRVGGLLGLAFPLLLAAATPLPPDAPAPLALPHGLAGVRVHAALVVLGAVFSDPLDNF